MITRRLLLGLGRPGYGWLGGPGIDIKSLLAKKSRRFDCLRVEYESVDYTRFDSMTGGEMSRSGTRFCSCCIYNQEEDDLAFFASALSANSEFLGEETSVSNMAPGLGAALAFAAVVIGTDRMYI